MGKRAICVYAKPPLPGRAKARLAGAIGAEAAAEVAYALLHDLLDRLRQIAPHLEAEVMIWYPPDALPEEFAPEFRGNITFLQQAGDDLGERMSNTFQYLLNEEGYDSALILGSDCVTFTEEVLGTAFDLLQRLPVVLQGAYDGGYVMVGQSVYTPHMFESMLWGHDQVMAITRRCLVDHGTRYGELTLTYDIDQVEDLEKLSALIDPISHPAIYQWLARRPKV